MEIKDIKVGDRVRIREWDDMAKEFGVDRDGDINIISSYFSRRMKQFCGKNVEVKSIRGNTFTIREDSYGFMFGAEAIAFILQSVTIFTDGKTTTAKMGENVGIAKCSPDDEFDFLTGANLALERLFEGLKPFVPKKLERYWFVDEDGTVCEESNEGLMFDLMAITLGNCFRTKKLAEKNTDRIIKEMGVK